MTQTTIDNITWPPHKGGLHITHNLHHSYHETIEHALEADNSTYNRDDFVNEDEIAKCIAADSVWSIQWFPDTPVGFCIVHAATLGRALERALES